MSVTALERILSAWRDRLPLRTNGRFVAIRSIDRVEADRNYVSLRVGSRVHTLRATIESMEERLRLFKD